MSEPLSLDAQLISRVRQFLQSTGYSQRQLARMLSCDAGNFSGYLAGAKSLSVTKMHKLLQILNLSRLELEARFAQPRLSSQILELHESGEKVEFSNTGWVAREPGEDSGDITNTPTARD